MNDLELQRWAQALDRAAAELRGRGELTEQARLELQQLLAADDGGRGKLQLVSVTVHLSAEVVRLQEDGAAADHAVEQLRKQLALELTRRQLRPLDPWPAVQVRRLVWGTFTQGEDGLPGGMGELHPDDPRPPDLFHLELRTPAVPDTRPVVL